MKIAAPLRLAAAISTLPLIIGCQTMSAESITVQTPTVQTPQDEALSKSVRDHLLTDKKVDLTGVKVVSSGGTVYLSGEVKSLDARQQAIKLAWEVRGVQSVVNTLEVEK
jgi:osmotically-inducible protein OsmY